MMNYPQNVPEAVLGALYGPVFLMFMVLLSTVFNKLKSVAIGTDMCLISL